MRYEIFSICNKLRIHNISDLKYVFDISFVTLTTLIDQLFQLFILFTRTFTLTTSNYVSNLIDKYISVLLGLTVVLKAFIVSCLQYMICLIYFFLAKILIISFKFDLVYADRGISKVEFLESLSKIGKGRLS